MMIKVLRIFMRWCDVATALIIFSKDLTAQDRAKIKMLLVELKEAVKDLEKELE
jgi:hypothetical protein